MSNVVGSVHHMQSVELKPYLCNPQLLVVILVVLTGWQFRFSLDISQLLAKVIPVRGAKFKKPAFEQAFCFFASLTLTENRIQPGKHFIDNGVRYAFQTLAVPGRHIDSSGLVAANNACCFGPRLFQ